MLQMRLKKDSKEGVLEKIDILTELEEKEQKHTIKPEASNNQELTKLQDGFGSKKEYCECYICTGSCCPAIWISASAFTNCRVLACVAVGICWGSQFVSIKLQRSCNDSDLFPCNCELYSN